MTGGGISELPNLRISSSGKVSVFAPGKLPGGYPSFEIRGGLRDSEEFKAKSLTIGGKGSKDGDRVSRWGCVLGSQMCEEQ